MSKCLEDELYDIYIEDGKQVIESLIEAIRDFEDYDFEKYNIKDIMKLKIFLI